MASRGIRLVVAVLFLALCLAASRSALASNPTVPQGGSASFPSTAHDTPAVGSVWDVKNPSGTVIASSNSPSGWNVSFVHSTSILTVSAPSSAPIHSGYEARYFWNGIGQSLGGGYSAYFDVIAMPAISSLSVSPTSVIGGATPYPTATVTLGSVAPTGGASVSLQSNKPSEASIQTSVTVPAGSTSATVTVTTYSVSSADNVTLTATYSGSTQNATLRVVPQPSLSSLSLNPASVTGATSSTGTVTLSSEAPSAGITVSLSDSNSNTYNPPASSVPSSVTIAAGATTATFTVTTTAVPAVTTATITGTYNSGNQTATLTINPPILNTFTISPTSTKGGQDVTATFTLNGPAPAGGASVSLSCSNNSAASVPSASPTSLPTSVVVPAGNTTLNFTIHSSTVNYAITITFTATYNATLTATLTLNLANLWVSDIYMPYTISLVWDATANNNNFKLTRSTYDGANWNLQATLYPTQQSYLDALGSNFVSGQDYLYQLYDNNNGTLLAQEQVAPYQSNTTEDQTVDSRIDPRYSTLKYLDFQFGGNIYRGGLYVGYMYAPQGQSTPPDSSRIGRSFAKFPLSASPPNNTGTFRAGDINAYFTGCNTDQGAASVTVGCQQVSPNSWVGSTLTWDSAPSVTPANASSTKTVTSSDTPAVHWVYWPLIDAIKSTLSGSQLLSVAWASMNESTNDWAYFAKLEYDSTLAPCAMYVYDLPVPTSVSVTPNPVPANSGATGSVTVNGLGPGDPSVTVSLFCYALPSGVLQVPATITVSSLNNPATFSIPIPTGTPANTYYLVATCNNVSATGSFFVQQH